MAGRPYTRPSPRIVTPGRHPATPLSDGKLFLAGLALGVLDGTANQLDQLERTAHTGAHVYPRVDLSKIGDDCIQLLQQGFGFLHALVGLTEQYRVRPGRGPVRAHDVWDVEPLALEVVENAHALVDWDHQLARPRGDDSDVAASALAAQPCRELRVAHLPQRLHTHPDSHLDA